MLLKAEFMYGEASEVLVAEHTILGPRRISQKVVFLLRGCEELGRPIYRAPITRKEILSFCGGGGCLFEILKEIICFCFRL